MGRGQVGGRLFPHRLGRGLWLVRSRRGKEREGRMVEGKREWVSIGDPRRRLGKRRMRNGGWGGRRLSRGKMTDAVSRRMESVQRLAIGRSHAGEGGGCQKGGRGSAPSCRTGGVLEKLVAQRWGGWGQWPGERGCPPSARGGSERGGA